MKFFEQVLQRQHPNKSQVLSIVKNGQLHQLSKLQIDYLIPIILKKTEELIEDNHPSKTVFPDCPTSIYDNKI